MKILDATGTNFLDVDIEHDVQIDKVIDAMGRCSAPAAPTSR